ncbi:DUF2889 domain-containing protein [Bradyrhizobium sp. 76]|uniref:DUF2889 domain-containing protein n=1 Tax=Bradyrhizobium sp. 76 TaxID=2782680 RepID=UPI001FFBF88D|nr:DUF2889 domain-containing protein [Bradyrhizobium sp. 76]MCK1410473.1 DUF2889 domain-containing protein [Bradyrhizobium sp. 76]
MPLPPPIERDVLHRRSIEVVGYRRRDQLWDIEARLIDSKANAYANPWRGEVPPGEPVHDMSLRLTVDTGFKIRAIEVASDMNPYPPCSGAVSAFAQLVGLTIGPGWKKKIKEHIGQTAGCIHLAELLGLIGSVMFQTILQVLEDEGAFKKYPRPGLIDSCYAYRRSGEVVRRLWPNLPAE